MELKTTVRTREGRRFEAEVANLTPNTLFLRTAQPLAFRDVLQLQLLEHTVRAVVIFACGHPRGAVVWFESPEPLRQSVRQVMPGVPVEAPPPVDADAWREITNTKADAADRTPPSGTPFTEEPSTPGALEAPWEEPSRDVVPGSTAAPPNPGLPPLPTPEAARTEREPAGRVEELPQLDRDGCTVRFASASAYREQFQSHLIHGGLVVVADPVPVGTQRMLVLTVPHARPYTVSARVVFNQPGVVGFMLDSFGLHRERLESLGG